MKKLSQIEETILAEEFPACPEEIVLSTIYSSPFLSEKVEDFLEEINFIRVDFLSYWWEEKFLPTYYDNFYRKNRREAIDLYMEHVHQYFPNFEPGIAIRKLTFTDKVPQAIQKRIKNFVTMRNIFKQEIIKKITISLIKE